MRTSEEIAKEIVDNGMRVKQHIHSPVETMSDNLKLHITKAIAAERARAQGLVDALEFYANGGNFNRDIWIDEKLGYFTGKRARQALADFSGEHL